MHEFVIIGAGLFGSIITRALRYSGLDVLLIDDYRPEAGSHPAACLMKPGWFSSMGKAVYDPALETLDRLYDLRELSFKLGPASTSVFWVSPVDILSEEVTQDAVKRVTPRGAAWHLACRSGAELEARTVIVAAGIWTQLLVPEVQQRGLAGVAFLYPNQNLETPFIRPWAPFKQIVGFNRGDGMWVSDGTSILRSNWSATYEEKSRERCTAASGATGEPKVLFGIRPFHEQKPCLLQEARPRLWVASGGAKNGTLAAAWCAHELTRRLS